MGSRCLGNDEYAGQQRRGGMGSRLHGNDGRGASSAGEGMGSRCLGNDGRGASSAGVGWVPVFSGTTAGGASSAGEGWVPVVSGTTAGGPAVPGWDGFPFARERRLGGQQCRGGMGSRCLGNDGRGASSAGVGWVPDFSGTTAGGASSAGEGWVPVVSGTTAGEPAVPGWDGFPLPRERRPGGQQCRGGMGSRCHGNDGRGASSAGVGWVPVATGTTAGGPAVPGRDGFPLPRERRPGGQQCRGGMGSRCHGNDGRGRERDWGCGILGVGGWQGRVVGFSLMYEVGWTAGWGVFGRGRCACRRSARGVAARG